MTLSEHDTIVKILRTARTVATVGLTDDPTKQGNIVPTYLQAHGYRIIPVNPRLTEALGEKAFASLRDIDEPVDVVQIFRRSDQVGPIVDDAIAIGAKAVWMQVGVANEEAAARARAAGLDVVMNQCMKAQHMRLTAADQGAPPGGD